MDKDNSVLAWHFVESTLRDGSPIPANGVKLVHEGPLELCRSGYHASVKVLDALKYAPGSTACRVRCSGVTHGRDKLVCFERTILWRVDASNIISAFTRRQALGMIHLWDAPKIVVDYLTSGDERIRVAAWIAARAAVGAAAGGGDVAWAATWAAAGPKRWSAARDDAWAATRAAAGVRCWSDARDDAWAVAWNDAETMLVQMLYKEGAEMLGKGRAV